MTRAGRVNGGIAAVLALALLAPAAGAIGPPEPWDGANPFRCELQQAGFGPAGPNPEADPYCVEFDKRRQNVTELGIVDFLAKEPARVAAALSKCFYFQSDHWRAAVVQDDGSTKLYEWDGHYFFDKARAEGGVWVTNFNVNGQTGDPSSLPGFPPEWDPFFGPGTGGVRTRNELPADPRCAERAEREGPRLYAQPPFAPMQFGCAVAGGPVTSRRLGPVRIGDGEDELRRTLGPPARVHRGFLRWCLAGGGRLLAGQRGDRSGELGEGDEPTLLALATHRAFAYRGVGPGSSVRALKRRLPGARRGRARGATVLYVAGRRGAVVFGAHGRRVRFIAVRDPRAIRGARALRAWLGRAR